MLYNNIIQQVSILGSSICNLSCSYCYLHNQKTQSFYHTLNKEIQEAWLDGSYVNNIKKVYEKIKADPLKTTRMELWGGEPLIQIDNLLTSSRDLFEFFPNVNFFMIPTNFAWPERIAQRISKLILDFDETRKTNQKCGFHLQLSIDSYDGILLEQGHHADNSQYLKNFEILIQELSKVNLTNTIVLFDIHATASGQNILKHLSKEEDIIKYLDDMFFLKKYVDNLIEKYQCKNVIYGELPYFPLCAVPENSTTEEGYKYTNIVKKLEVINHKYKYVQNSADHFADQISHNNSFLNVLNKNHECPESNYEALMILPDGTISECACSYVANRPELQELLLQNKQYDDYRLAITREKYFFNPITDSKEKEQFNDWYNLTGIRHNYSTALNLSMCMCQELALSKQIDWVYAADPYLLLKHLSKETSPYSCTREQLGNSGLPFLAEPGDFRRIFNGEINFVDSLTKNECDIIIKEWLLNDSAEY